MPLKSDPRAAKWLDRGIDVCKALRLPVVLAACFGKGDLDMATPPRSTAWSRYLKPIAAKAEKLGVTIGLENYLSAEDNMRIIDRVGSPAVKVYYDVGNSTDKGRDVTKEIRKLGKLICEFHAKDGRYMLGQGRIDFQQVRKAMDDIGYSGWIQIEAATPARHDGRLHCRPQVPQGHLSSPRAIALVFTPWSLPTMIHSQETITRRQMLRRGARRRPWPPRPRPTPRCWPRRSPAGSRSAPATGRWANGSDPAALDLAKQIGLDGVQVDLGTVGQPIRLAPARRPEGLPRSR